MGGGEEGREGGSDRKGTLPPASRSLELVLKLPILVNRDTYYYLLYTGDRARGYLRETLRNTRTRSESGAELGRGMRRYGTNVLVTLTCQYAHTHIHVQACPYIIHRTYIHRADSSPSKLRSARAYDSRARLATEAVVARLGICRPSCVTSSSSFLPFDLSLFLSTASLSLLFRYIFSALVPRRFFSSRYQSSSRLYYTHPPVRKANLSANLHRSSTRDQTR